MTTPAPNTASNSTPSTTEILPGIKTLQQAAKIAIEQDKAIMLDYYRETGTGTAFLAEDSKTKERILVKSKEEYTSLINKLYKIEDDYIVLTENSLYIVSVKIGKRNLNLSSLYEANDSSL